MPKQSPMTKNVSALIARTQFGQILDRVSKNRERFLVTRKGQGAAVILSVEDFLESFGEPPESLKKLQEDARRSGAAKMSLEDIEALIAKVRQEKSKARA